MGDGSQSGRWWDDDAPTNGSPSGSGDRPTSPVPTPPVSSPQQQEPSPTTADSSTVSDVNGSDSAPAPTRVWVLPTIAGLVLAAVLGTLLGLVIVGRSGGDDELADVRLEPVTFRSGSPFVDSIVTMDDDELLSAAALMADVHGEGEVPVGRVSGGTARLYGSRGPATPPCDSTKLVERLEADDGALEAWAGIMGVDPDGVSDLVRSLTPVLLAVDTAVTNHVYGPDGASSLQAVLQAGTPVLVDQLGSPRVQCSCGNPLLPPRQVDEPTITGERWDTYDPDRVVEVEPAPDPLEVIITVDVETGEDVEVRTGGALVLDGLLFTTDDGVYVVDGADRVTRVIDGPVRAVFDDGEGGLVFQPGSPGEIKPDRVPSDPDQRAIWRLPAGAEDPVVIVDGSDPAVWHLLRGAGSLGGSPHVAHSPLSEYWDEVFGKAWDGTSLVLDLSTGESVDLDLREFGDGGTYSIEFSEELVVANYSADAHDGYYVYDTGLEPVEVPCVQGFQSYDDADCPFKTPLTSDGRLVVRTDGEPHTTSTNGVVTIAAIDPISLQELDRWTIRDEFAPGESGEVELDVVEADGDQVIVSYSVHRSGSWIRTGAAVVDLGHGTVRDLGEIDGMEPYDVHILRSPLIRPATADLPVDEAESEVGAPERDRERSPRWEQFKDAEIPAICDFDPVRLVDGVNPVLEEAGRDAHDPMPQFFLREQLGSGGVSIVHDVPSDAGPLTAVVAHCDWGAAPDASPVLFFGADGEFYAYSDLEPDRWPDPNAVGVGREGVRSMRLADDEIEVEVPVWLGKEPACCPEGRAVMRLRPTGGRIEITSVEM